MEKIYMHYAISFADVLGVRCISLTLTSEPYIHYRQTRLRYLLIRRILYTLKPTTNRHRIAPSSLKTQTSLFLRLYTSGHEIRSRQSSSSTRKVEKAITPTPGNLDTKRNHQRAQPFILPLPRRLLESLLIRPVLRHRPIHLWR